MPTYTVHEPPLRNNESAPDPVRFLFVRDGFYFWAFLLPPIWMLARRLWLVLVLYLIVDALIGAGLYFIGASTAVKVAVGFLICLLVGFEAGTLWRWTLARRKWKTLGTVIGEDRELAERRFFAAWQTRGSGDAATPNPPPSVQHRNATPVRRDPPASDIIGLFPEPEHPR